MKGRKDSLKSWGVIALATIFLSVFTGGMAWAQLSGAIYTSLGDGTGTNINLYEDKCDVYLNGGPPPNAPCTSGGLPDGDYYFQVTNPSGAVLLSEDDISCRRFTVSDGVIVDVVNPTGVTNPTQCGEASNPTGAALGTCDPPVDCPHNTGTGKCPGAISIQLMPYYDTPNPGGEYKVWVTPMDEYDSTECSGTFGFVSKYSKTDNFKVRGTGGGDPNTICGMKFYDANLSGVRDEIEPGILEPGIPLWKIWIYGGANGFIPYETNTAGNGVYSFLNLDNGIYNLCEVIPENEPVWVPTTPTAITGIEVPPDAPDNDFGNICLGEGGGHTIGFWRNKNGQALIELSDCDVLAILNLVEENGDPFVPSTTNLSQCRTQIKNWLKNARAVNMAYMLSAQLAAMALNVLEDFVDLYAYVYIGEDGCGIPGSVQTDSGRWFITIYDLGLAAIYELGTPGHNITTAGSPYRAYQECLKDVLDAANNNENFVQAEPCEVNYSGEEPSCIPTP